MNMDQTKHALDFYKKAIDCKLVESEDLGTFLSFMFDLLTLVPFLLLI
jgi:hypothetical protein